MTTINAKEEDPLLPSPTAAIIKKPKRNIIVEPVVLLYFFSVIGGLPVTSQFIFVEIGKQYNYTQAGIGNHDNSTKCLVNTSDPNYILQQKIESEATIFTLFSSVMCSCPAIIVSLYMGGYTDKRGRRLGIIMPIFGSMIQGFVYLSVMYFELNIYFLFIGSLISGLSGYFTVFLMAAFAYIADCTSHENRTTRIIVIELLAAVASSLANVGLGYMITNTGFFWPMVLLTSAQVLAFTYALFFVPETIIPSSDTSISVVKILKDGFRVCTKEYALGRPAKLCVLLCALVCILMIVTGSSTVQQYFLMNSPLCLTSMELGLINGALGAIIAGGSVLGIVLFLKVLKLRDTSVALIGCASCILRYALFGLSSTRLLVYIAISAGLWEFLATPLLRSRLSKTVSDSEQGALFSMIAAIEGVTTFGGNFLWNAVYANTLYFYKGFAFIAMACVIAFSAVFIMLYRCLYENSEHKLQKKRGRDALYVSEIH